MKTCISCKEEKYLGAYSKDVHRKDMLSPYCKSCQRVRRGSTRTVKPRGLSPEEGISWYRDNRSIVTESDCWQFEGATNKDGYGTVRHMDRPWYLHILSYEISKGATNGEPVHHICANRACFNPDHLQLVSQRENIAEMKERNYYIRRIAELEAETERIREIVNCCECA